MSGKEDAFCSWSGGKDSCLALYRSLGEGYMPRVLFSLLDERGTCSRSHGLSAEILRAQARCLGLELEAIPCPAGKVAEALEGAARRAVRGGCRTGIFGDIFVEEHRRWVTELAGRCGFRPVFPLWGQDTSELAREFVSAGFKAVVVSVRKDVLDAALLGKEVDKDFLSFLQERSLDPCGENGEYHTLVYDGPSFREPLGFLVKGVRESERCYHLEIALG